LKAVPVKIIRNDIVVPDVSHVAVALASNRGLSSMPSDGAEMLGVVWVVRTAEDVALLTTVVW